MSGHRVIRRAVSQGRSHAAGNAGPRSRRVRLADAAAFLALVAVLATVSALPTAADLVSAPASTRLVRVEQSDTLWGIARAHGADGVTTAQTVSAIRRLNRLPQGSTLQPGTVVAVPCDQASDALFALR